MSFDAYLRSLYSHQFSHISVDEFLSILDKAQINPDVSLLIEQFKTLNPYTVEIQNAGTDTRFIGFLYAQSRYFEFDDNLQHTFQHYEQVVKTLYAYSKSEKGQTGFQVARPYKTSFEFFFNHDFSELITVIVKDSRHCDYQ